MWLGGLRLRLRRLRRWRDQKTGIYACTQCTTAKWFGALRRETRTAEAARCRLQAGQFTLWGPGGASKGTPVPPFFCLCLSVSTNLSVSLSVYFYRYENGFHGEDCTPNRRVVTPLAGLPHFRPASDGETHNNRNNGGGAGGGEEGEGYEPRGPSAGAGKADGGGSEYQSEWFLSSWDHLRSVLKLLSDESTEFRGNSVLALLRRLVLVSEVRGISPEGSSNDAGGGILLAPCTADREAAAGKAAVTPCPALHFTWRNDLEGVQRLGIPALESVLLSPPFYARPHLGKMHSGSSQAGVVADAPGLAASAFRAAYDGAGASGAAVGRLGIWRKEIESYYGISDATSDAAATHRSANS